MNDFLHRRLLLQGALAGSAASFANIAAAREPAAPGRGTGAKQNDAPYQVLFLWLAGGASQFEMWDPKPGRATGGPFRAISTSVPGVQIGELMPRVAKRMHKLSVVRSLSTGISEHFQAADLISTGRPKESALDYPELGVTLAKELSRGAQQLPDYISIFRTSEGRRRAEPGFLGAAQLPIHLEKSIRPENIDRPKELSAERFAARAELRRELSRGFLSGRADRAIAAPFESAHARTAGLMESTAPFDLEREPAAVRERYGRTPFGRHCLLARRLLEAGVPVVKVARGFWDSHHDNFESHRELVPDFDRVFSTLLDDLDERGLLERTLVMVLSEFGRTPKINKDVGRDHYATAWSCAFAGARTRPGAVFGRTDKDGAQVTDGKLNAGDLAATILAAVGVDHQKHYQVGLRPVPLAPEESKPAKEILI
jgi:uncharacterized protein (DUF1501 family)